LVFLLFRKCWGDSSGGGGGGANSIHNYFNERDSRYCVVVVEAFWKICWANREEMSAFGVLYR